MVYRDPQLDDYLPMAEELWRARTRLERGDRALAEPIFSRMFTQTNGQSHETALMVAEGLMRVRLARGANAAAVIPMLEVIRMRRMGVKSDSFTMLQSLIEEVEPGEMVCVQLPPLFVRTNDLRLLVKELESYDAQEDAYVRHLAQGYKRAAENTLHATADTKSDLDGARDTFVDNVINTRWSVYEPSKGRPARSQRNVGTEIDALPEWAQLWSLYASGSQKMESPDLNVRDRGIVQLASVASFSSDRFPYITGLALGDLAVELEKEGQLESALSLRRELQVKMPRHPIEQQIPPLPREAAESEKTQEETQ